MLKSFYFLLITKCSWFQHESNFYQTQGLPLLFWCAFSQCPAMCGTIMLNLSPALHMHFQKNLKPQYGTFPDCPPLVSSLNVAIISGSFLL